MKQLSCQKRGRKITWRASNSFHLAVKNPIKIKEEFKILQIPNSILKPSSYNSLIASALQFTVVYSLGAQECVVLEINCR